MWLAITQLFSTACSLNVHLIFVVLYRDAQMYLNLKSFSFLHSVSTVYLKLSATHSHVHTYINT